MPELPEVETVRAQIEPHIVRKKITKIVVNKPKLTGNDEDFEKKLIGESFTGIDRIGKLMIFRLQKNSNEGLLAHLKMTGQFIFADADGQLAGGGHTISESDLNLPTKHSHIIFYFEDGSKLYFNDMRQFGYIKFASNQKINKTINGYGIEPMTDNYTWENFKKLFTKNRRTNIKAFLLNQKIISGLGNIYVDEALFKAKIHPTRLVNTITEAEQKKLFPACESVMKEALNNGGTTFYSFTRADGSKGNHSDYLLVFNRQGELCVDCDTEIEKIKCAGRGTHFCPKCQV
ncbi:DNA-formamidopyrimidine glycosylase [bacterium DOLZORAL124_38_8]|nr:MAG: DNA-formamidopyrimidine glycosylase [bacterium DOLZORAL124_38_8]